MLIFLNISILPDKFIIVVDYWSFNQVDMPAYHFKNTYVKLFNAQSEKILNCDLFHFFVSTFALVNLVFVLWYYPIDLSYSSSFERYF